MIGNTESAEIQNSYRVIDLVTRTHEKERDLPDEIRMKGDQVGTGSWSNMLEMTTQDGKEKGLTVSKDLFGKIFTSAIAQGHEIRSGVHRVEPPALPLLNQGISYIHTHPPLEKVNPNIPTTMMDDDDCSIFFKNKAFPCSVMIDEGGVHLLLREKSIMPNRSNFPENATAKSIEESNGLALDAMKRLANTLARFGIRYYFSPSRELLTDGTIALKDVRKYTTLAKPNKK